MSAVGVGATAVVVDDATDAGAAGALGTSMPARSQGLGGDGIVKFEVVVKVTEGTGMEAGEQASPCSTFNLKINVQIERINKQTKGQSQSQNPAKQKRG